MEDRVWGKCLHGQKVCFKVEQLDAEMLGNCWWEPVLLSTSLESATPVFLSTEEVSWSSLEKEAKCNIRCCAPQISDHH